MYLGHRAQEADASEIPRGRSVTEPALMKVSGRTRSIPTSTRKAVGGGVASSQRESGGRHELPTYKQRQARMQPRLSTQVIRRRQRPGGGAAGDEAAVLKQ